MYLSKNDSKLYCVVVTYQIDCVKHLNLSYRSTAWVGKITVVVADGQGAQSWRNISTDIN